MNDPNNALLDPRTAGRPGPDRVLGSLRVGLASAVALIVCLYWHLPDASLAVYTTHMVMSSHARTTFQKGLERFLGRALGIFLGLVIIQFFREPRVLGLALAMAGILAFSYAHFAGRLAYTNLNAAIYLSTIGLAGSVDPRAAWVSGGWLLLAVAVGVWVAWVVAWATGEESDLGVDPGPGPIFPLRGVVLGHAAQLTATILMTQYVFFILDLPPASNTFVLVLLSIAPDVQIMLAKGRFLLAGAFFAAVYAVVATLILQRLSHLPLLVALLFFGMFLASYVARSKSGFGPLGTQMGQVLPIMLVLGESRTQSPPDIFLLVLYLIVVLIVSIIIGALGLALGLPPAQPKGNAPASGHRPATSAP